MAAQSFDVNDASFLFPLDEGGLLPKLTLEDESMISQRQLHDLLLFDDPNGKLDDLRFTDLRYMTRLNSWAVTSWRLDPCGEKFELVRDGVKNVDVARRLRGCVSRLRIVAQPLNLLHQPLASAMHVLYDLDAEGLKEIADALIDLKTAAALNGYQTTGFPLMVHPVLKAELKTPSKPFASGLSNVLRRGIRRGKLSMITLSVRESVNHWKFVAGTIQAGRWVLFVTDFSSSFYENSRANEKVGVEDLTCDELSICRFAPVSMNVPSQKEANTLNEIFRPDRLVEQIPGRRSLEVRRKAELIDNPDSIHFFNTNCISCHVSSSLRDREELLGSPFLRPGITPFVPRRLTSTNLNSVINFGYFGSIPRVSTRTAADAVSSADLLNKFLGLPNPSDISRDPQRFWNCLLTERDFTLCLTF